MPNNNEKTTERLCAEHRGHCPTATTVALRVFGYGVEHFLRFYSASQIYQSSPAESRLIGGGCSSNGGTQTKRREQRTETEMDC